MENKEDKEKIDSKLQTELLVEIEIHERRVLDVLERLSKKSDEDLPAEFKDASIVLASATKELKVLMKEHENDKEVYENLIDTISKRVATIPEEFVVKNLEDFPTKFEFKKPDWWEEYPKPKEFPNEIKISNLPKSQDNKDLKSHLTKLFTGIWEATKEHTARVFVSNRTPKEAIPVVLVDAEGRQKYTAIFSGGGSGGGGTSGIQDVNILSEVAPSTLVSFVTDIPTATNRVQLASNTIVAGVIQAPSTNAGNIFVGGSNVSSTVFGSELQPGQSTGVAINNTDKIWVDVATNGDDVAFMGS